MPFLKKKTSTPLALPTLKDPILAQGKQPKRAAAKIVNYNESTSTTDGISILAAGTGTGKLNYNEVCEERRMFLLPTLISPNEEEERQKILLERKALAAETQKGGSGNGGKKRGRGNTSNNNNDDDPSEENDKENRLSNNSKEGKLTKFIPALIRGLGKPFKIPSTTGSQVALAASMPRQGTLGLRKMNNLFKRPLHDPNGENALILFAPPELTETEKLALKSKSSNLVKTPGKDALGIINNNNKEPELEVHVVVDPRLTKVLRPHQRDGVAFMYECVTGNRVENFYGCIMADEMGLGKTLQCITLLWTLLRQSPTPGKATIEKALIVCPSSLVRNWANELIKWLGPHSVTPLACDGKLEKAKMKREMQKYIAGMGRNKVYHVLIISYETLRIWSDFLGQTEIGLMLCDEGHRLKNSQNLTFNALNALNAKRRVILSGTPIQNDLTEYFSLLNFANPGLLGEPSEFKKKYENPILRGRDAEATDEEKRISETKLSEMLQIASKVIIRRTSDLLSKYLPTKYDHVVFVKLTEPQAQIYEAYTTSKELKQALRAQAFAAGEGNGKSNTGGFDALKQIMILKKLVNHPSLLLSELEDPQSILSPSLKSILRNSMVQTGIRGGADIQPALSGKLHLLDKMLKEIKTKSDDRVVLISNYTQTLDIFQRLCAQRQYNCLRLDGTLTIGKRQKLVDEFNDPESNAFVFLLSSKAGGCGINLIGGNRLILFDPDWNPATDGQALARVWRDGQKKNCFLYRFIATGTIEEKIFQRQCHKQSLSDCVVDEDLETERHFSVNDMRQLFVLNLKTPCDTHDTYKCKRCVMGRQVITPLQAAANEVSEPSADDEQLKIEKGFKPPAEGIVGLDVDELSASQLKEQQKQRQLEEEEEIQRNADLILVSDDDLTSITDTASNRTASIESVKDTKSLKKVKTSKKSTAGKLETVAEAESSDTGDKSTVIEELNTDDSSTKEAENSGSKKVKEQSSSSSNANSRKTKDMSNWNHFSALESDKMPDQVLKACCKGLMTFCFQSTTDKKK